MLVPNVVTLPLAVEEMNRLLVAVDEVRVWGVNAKLKEVAEVGYKVKALVLLQLLRREERSELSYCSFLFPRRKGKLSANA